jgi:pyruvate formate lyase activating enzyme
MNFPLITNIQKYSIHDGEGIRTTVFFKGCPLTCTWCHNPETQSFSKQLLFQAEKCTGCGSCVNACPSHAVTIKDNAAYTKESLCVQCGNCEDYCLQNIREMSGKYYTVDELVKEVEKDRAFYEQSHGGITLSGGEVLSQDMTYLLELLEKLSNKGYRVNIDTCGYAPFERFRQVLPFTHTFLYDVKLMDNDLHKKYTGVANQLILDNLKKLSNEGAKIWIRLPLIKGINDRIEHIKELGMFLKEEDILAEHIHLLPYHNTGSNKYTRLNKKYMGEDYKTPSNEELKQLADILHTYGSWNIIIGG